MNFRHNAKRIFNAALIVWLSGIVVLFCCVNMPAKADVDKTESCPLAKKGHCAKPTETNSESSFGQEPLIFDCCIFPAKIFDKVRKLEKSPEFAAAAETIEIKTPKFFLIEKTFKSPKFYQSFVRNRGSTHVQNCVFII